MKHYILILLAGILFGANLGSLFVVAATSTTRSDAVALVVQVYELTHGSQPEPSSCPFEDIAADPNRSEICKAYALRITAGTSATTFSPNERTPLWQWAIFLGKARMASVYSPSRGSILGELSGL